MHKISVSSLAVYTRVNESLGMNVLNLVIDTTNLLKSALLNFNNVHVYCICITVYMPFQKQGNLMLPQISTDKT